MFILVCGPKRIDDLAWFVARNLKILGQEVESVDFTYNQPQDSIFSRAKYKLKGYVNNDLKFFRKFKEVYQGGGYAEGIK